ncbi:MAG TPA: NAD(P)/FAD-dependent oxidoreductase [Candidatus Peribacteraceae bacterium]|nr:NAD(P)/FAD-dependent oxidoreductase [Candidatus Peribacteraceae bacterium]
MNTVIIGAGINGEVCANYLARGGHSVTVLERADRVGGACVRHVTDIDGQTFSFPGGASVFGFMQDFVWRETGLADRLQFEPADNVYYYPAGSRGSSGPWRHMEEEDSPQFHADGEKVAAFLQKGFRDAEVPTLESANRQIGPELTKLWITGSARDLVDHYFTSPEQKIAIVLSVNESGPVGIDEAFSAFTISLMHTGSVDSEGRWGYVKGGIWRVTEELERLNGRLDVTTVTSARVLSADPDSGRVVYEKDGVTTALHADQVVFATEPLTAARLIKDRSLEEQISGMRLMGTSGKVVMFFRDHPRFKDGLGDTLRFLICNTELDVFNEAALSVKQSATADFVPGYLELYPESRSDDLGYGLLSVFFKHVTLGKIGEELSHVRQFVVDQVLALLDNPEDFIGSILRTPQDLCTVFGFAGGNIDHVEIANPHTYVGRTFSTHPSESFFQFGSHRRVYYCGAGTYPCGSVAGTGGYMCATQILRGQ